MDWTEFWFVAAFTLAVIVCWLWEDGKEQARLIEHLRRQLDEAEQQIGFLTRWVERLKFERSSKRPEDETMADLAHRIGELGAAARGERELDGV
jgi:hypothetical protein